MTRIRRLRSGVPALYIDHRTRKAKLYAREYRRLATLYPEAAREQDKIMTADAWATWCAMTWTLSAAERRRARGRGRRPAELDLSRLERRKQKAWGRYRALRTALETHPPSNGHGLDLAQRFAEHHREAGRA